MSLFFGLGDWVLLVIPVLFVGYVYLTWTHDYWKKRGVPYQEPKLFFGNYKDVILAKKTEGEVIEDIYWKFKGQPYGGIFRLSEPVIVVRDPELIKSILVKDFPSFQKNGFPIQEDLDPLLGRNPFFLDGERWKRVRSQLTPAFTSGKIKNLYPLLEEACKQLAQYLEKTAPSNRPDGLETKEVAAKYTTEVVGSCAFGIQGNSFKDPNAELRTMGRKLLEPTFWKNFEILIMFLFPKLGRILRIRFMPVYVADFFRKVISDVVSFREKNGVEANDFLQLLMQLKHKIAAEAKMANGQGSDPKYEYTDEDVTAHAVTFFTDGFETSSIALSFIFYELAMNPEVQEKLRMEVEDVLRKNGGAMNHEAILQMTYLEKVMCETLRIHAPLMAMAKICTSPFDLPTPSGGKYTVEPGTMIMIPVKGIHSDPQYYPEPEKFIPDRFSEENRQTLNKYVYLPFGEGPRMCLGMRFAHAQIKTAVSHIVRHFEIKKTHKTPDPVTQDPNFFMTAAKGGLWLDFVKRKN